MMKKTLSVIITVLIITTTVIIFPVDALAASSGRQLGDYFKEYYYDENHVLYETIYDENGEEVEFAEEETLCTMSVGNTIPAKYDSRNYGFVTSVKDQNPYGSCWAFAFTGAAESSLVAQGYAPNTVDLSEAHLIWFRKANYVPGSTVPVQQDSIDWIRDTFDDGGSDFNAVATAARWSGFALESDYPYVNTYNSAAMQFDSSEMFANDYNLVSARRLTKNNTNEVKQAIMNYGSVSATMYYSSDAINYSPDGCCHFQKKESGVNHGVTVVGWDDNFSKSNFKIAPPANGAWLVKNSWGTDVNDDGYFWLSYSDKSCKDFMEVVAKPAGDYDCNYQYDGQLATASISYTRTAYGANVFTANGYETIKGAGFYTFNSLSYTCTVSVYTDLADPANPVSGTLRGSKNISCSKEGYYTVDFDGEYDVQPGEKFAVVVKYYNPSGSAFVPYENLNTTDYTYSVAEGQSFYSGSLSNWQDVTAQSGRGNIPIKAFTKQSSTPELCGIGVTEFRKTVYEPDSIFNPDDITVSAFWSDGTSSEISKEALFITGFDSSRSGTLNIEFRGFTTSCSYTVPRDMAASIEINTLPYKTEYEVGEEFDPSGLSLRVQLESGEIQTVTDGYTAEVDMSSAGTQTVTVTYDGITTTFEITVKAITVEYCELASIPGKLQYEVGDKELDTNGIQFRLVYSNGVEELITEGFTCTGFIPGQAGEQTITVTYGDYSGSFVIKVIDTEVRIVALEVVKNPHKTDYFTGEKIDTTGLVLNAIYSDGTVKKITSGYNVKTEKANGSGTKHIPVTYQGVSTKFSIHVTLDFGQLIRDIFRNMLSFDWIK